MTEITCPKCGETVGSVADSSSASFFHCGKSVPTDSYPDLDLIRYGGLTTGKKYTALRQTIRWLESKEDEHRRLVRYLIDARAALAEVVKIQDASTAHGIHEDGGKLRLNASQKKKIETVREILRVHATNNGIAAPLDNADDLRAYCKEHSLPEMV